MTRDPDNIQSAKTLPNRIVGQIKVTVFNQDNPRFNRVFIAYFVEFSGTPHVWNWITSDPQRKPQHI